MSIPLNSRTGAEFVKRRHISRTHTHDRPYSIAEADVGFLVRCLVVRELHRYPASARGAGVNALSVAMLVMHVGEVRMPVAHGHVLVLMRVRFDAVPLLAVTVLVVCIVPMGVRVNYRLV